MENSTTKEKILKYFFFTSIIFIIVGVILIFSPVLKSLDRLLISKEKIILLEKQATDGNMTAMSDLIFYSTNEKYRDKWDRLFLKEREKRKKEYYLLKKQSKEGNQTATAKIQKLIKKGYF